MSQEKIIKELQSFHLTPEESKAYLFLLRSGPKSAGKVARYIKSYRMKTYRILRELEKRGLIEATIERPQKFVAVPLEKGLELQINERKEKLSKLERSRDAILEQWKKNYVEPDVEHIKIRIIQGRKQFFNFLDQLIEKAVTEINLLTTKNDLYRLSLTEITDRLRAANKKGVKIKLLTQMDRSAVSVINEFTEFSEVRHTVLSSSLRFLIIDNEDVLSTFAMDDSMNMKTQEDTTMWTNAPNYATTVTAYFMNLWNQSEKAESILPKLVSEQKLQESLGLIQKALQDSVFTVDTFGEVTGKSGNTHTFKIVAKHKHDSSKFYVLDFAEEDPVSDLTALFARVMDVKPTSHFLATTKSLDKEATKLAQLYGTKIIQAKNPQQLTAKIISVFASILEHN